MKNIIITKDLALNAGITSINDVNLLTEGALAVFDDKNRMLTAVNVVANMADSKAVKYVTKYGGSMHWSNSIVREHARVEAQPSRTAVKPVIFIGNDGSTGSLNLPSTLVSGMIAHIRLVKEIPIREVGTEKQRFEYTVKNGDTPAIVVAALVAKINAKSERFANAVMIGAGLGIQLTVVDFDTVITVGLDGILEDANKIKDGTSNSVALDYGAGTFSQIEELEETYSTRSGNTNKIELASYFFKRQNVAVVGTLYDTYTINHDRFHSSPTATEHATNQTLIIAIPDGASMQADLETIQTAVYGLAGGNEETGDDTAV